MENPEEVLQALDEFQKMRPSEIPRELEEYLSWVAKTGDPVYQWSLVKPLFREKLTRVMTDFYESCPSLELAPCPNVEQFNYDFMKCNLLELLESFANAPFTVQRICELLTAPRKEYNRVDKFMRAIEKNILVVSTVEPGPAARRSENGAEGMVNGTMDEEAPARPAHEVEMETWAKDCESAATGRAEETTPDTVLPSAGKQLAKTNEETLQIRSKSDVPIVGGGDSPGEVAGAETPEVSTTVGVSPPEVAVMNEDTNSQPAPDSETETSESPGSRKLQTTFRTKDFARKDEELREEVKTDKSRLEADEDASPDDAKSEEPRCSAEKSSFQCRNPDAAQLDELPEKRARIDRLIDDLETIESATDEDSAAKKESSAEKTDDREVPPADAPPTECPEDTESTPETTISEEPRLASRTKIDEPEAAEDKTTKKEVVAESLEDTGSSSATLDISRPIVEEPSSDEAETRPISETAAQDEPTSGVTIEEAMDDDTRVNKSIIPDPIPIVEEPKEIPEQPARNPEITTVIEEIPEVPREPEASAETRSEVETPSSVVQETDTDSTVEAEITTVPENREDITDVRCPEETTLRENKIEPAESMEVDGEESLPAFQQDEPMEQEPGDPIKS